MDTHAAISSGELPGQRSEDLRDGCERDVLDILTEIRRLFLSYRQGELLYIYLINVFELLLQSARTRICLLRLPPSLGQVCTPQSVAEMVIFSSFRMQFFFDEFCRQMAEGMNQQGGAFLEREAAKLTADNGEALYICLPRIFPENQSVLVDRAANAEAFRRLEHLLQLLEAERRGLGSRLADDLFHCLTTIPAENRRSEWNVETISAANVRYFERPYKQDHLLEPLIEWVDEIYFECRQIPLLQAYLQDIPEEGKPSSSQLVEYSNIFFFIRINVTTPSVRKSGDGQDSFNVRLVCPETQKRELARFFHKNRAEQCQWHAAGSKCSVLGMQDCLVAPYWQQLDAAIADDERIYKHYAALWGLMEEPCDSTRTLAGAAFYNSSVVFDRRHRQLLDSGGESILYQDSLRDKVLTCVKCRLLPRENACSANPEDKVPQMMFVPVYSGGAPLMLVATVVNADRPRQLQVTLSEWQRSFRFAEMTFRFIASRFKEMARKGYLSQAADIVQDAYDHCTKIHAASALDRTDYFKRIVNHKLDLLAKVYPYHQIQLITSDKSVLKNHGRDVVEMSSCGIYEVVLSANTHWRRYSGKAFFSPEIVGRKFHSAISRAIAVNEEETRKRLCFMRWYEGLFDEDFPSALRSTWRDLAEFLNWEGDC